MSIRIEPGQTVALCGPSGSGKSTVLNLLLRFYDPSAGQVLLDGRRCRRSPRNSLRRHFALVQQETFLFNDSILDNIRYGHAEATMEQVIAAAKAANAHEFIARLPNGYDTKVGERGVRLSGGQKQRISIARAFLANPTVLLLDEPTSSVEPDTEAAIIAALDRLMAGRTTVLTSHRPSLINQADVVYVIEDGRVTEQGPPAGIWRTTKAGSPASCARRKTRCPSRRNSVCPRMHTNRTRRGTGSHRVFPFGRKLTQVTRDPSESPSSYSCPLRAHSWAVSP